MLNFQYHHKGSDSRWIFTHVPHLGTSNIYLCVRNFKKEVIMWFAVMVFVGLSVEVLSYLTGGEI